MATFLSSSNFNGKLGDKFQLELYFDVLQPQDIANNRSTIRYYLYWKSLGQYSGSGSTVRGYINSTQVGTTTSISNYENKLMGTLDVTIDHNPDGTFPDTGYSATIDTPWTVGDASVSGTLTSANVPRIPRTSSVTCTDGYIESSVSININQASDSFTHRLSYQFGVLSGEIAPAAKYTCGFTIPDTFYSQIPNSQSGVGSILCETYSGGALIGTSSCLFTARTDETKCKPDVDAVIEDINTTATSLTGSKDKLIRGISNIKSTISATPKNSASIVDVRIRCADGKEGVGASVQLNGVTSGAFTVSATDSRGYSSAKPITKSMVEYIILTLNPTFYRPEPTTGEIALKYDGNYFNGSFGNASNSLTVKYRYCEYGGKMPSTYTSLKPVISGNSYSQEISLGKVFDYKKTYQFEIIAEDKLGSVPKSMNVAEGNPILGLFKNFVLIGGELYVQLDDFRVPLIEIIDE